MELPLADRDLLLKQIRLEDLNDLGRTALLRAFTGFAGSAGFKSEQVEAHLNEMRSVTGVPNYVFDPHPYRRFAGDALLPRGRYYTIAGEANGHDGGTLVRELRSYYNPRLSGIIQVFDSTDNRDRQVLGRLCPSTPNLVVVFLPVRDTVNQFVRLYTSDPKPMLVLLPLRIERRHVKGVVDLRDPDVAATFAKALSRLEWNIRGVRTKCFAFRPPLESFRDLIPALLEQSLGGNGLTNVVGTWVRTMGAQGLVFPSARVDAMVDAREGKVIDASGWNFVDYTDGQDTYHEGFIDLGLAWPSYIQATPEGPHEDETPILIPSIEIDFQHEGSERGSWRVIGLRAAREAQWRFSMAMECIETISSRVAPESVQFARQWLLTKFVEVFPCQRDERENQAEASSQLATSVQELGSTCMVLQEALMGVPQKITEMRNYIEGIRASHDPLATALEDLINTAS